MSAEHDAALTNDELNTLYVTHAGVSHNTPYTKAIADAQLRKALWWWPTMLRAHAQEFKGPKDVGGALLDFLTRMMATRLEAMSIEPWPDSASYDEPSQTENEAGLC